MSEQKNPDYLTETSDGFLIDLATPIDLDGTQTSRVTMREPTVQDQLDVQAIKASEAYREVTLMANLCSLAPEQIKAMTMRNYRRLQGALEVFTE